MKRRKCVRAGRAACARSPSACCVPAWLPTPWLALLRVTSQGRSQGGPQLQLQGWPRCWTQRQGLSWGACRAGGLSPRPSSCSSGSGGTPCSRHPARGTAPQGARGAAPGAAPPPPLLPAPWLSNTASPPPRLVVVLGPKGREGLRDVSGFLPCSSIRQVQLEIGQLPPATPCSSEYTEMLGPSSSLLYRLHGHHTNTMGRAWCGLSQGRSY